MEAEYTSEGIEKQKTLIGEFIINFERLNEWMRFIIPDIIYGMYRTNKQTKNIETLLTDLGAFQIKAKFDSLIFDNFKDYSEFIKSTQSLSSKVSDLYDIRNSIAHGSYRLGWKDFEGRVSDHTLSIRHSKPTKTGYEKRSKIISTKDLKDLNNNLLKISSCYTTISVIIHNIMDLKDHKLAEKHIKKLNKEVNSIEKLKLPQLDILNWH